MKPASLLIPVLMLAACSRPASPDAGGMDRSHSNGDAPVATTVRDSAPPAAASTAPAPMPAPGTTAMPARADGYGDLRFGMTEREARAAWSGELKGDAVEPDNCAYLRPAADETFRIGFMFERGALVRYDVAVAEVLAPGGGRVGHARADIERLYPGRVQVQNHEYVPGGHYLRVTDPAIAGGALVFETDEAGMVTRWRAGRAPQVDYVEGCA